MCRYALLTYPDDAELTEDAEKRLAAIESCCELGDGFRIARLDAQIGGTGALFGLEQSGNSMGLGMQLMTRRHTRRTLSLRLVD